MSFDTSYIRHLCIFTLICTNPLAAMERNLSVNEIAEEAVSKNDQEILFSLMKKGLDVRTVEIEGEANLLHIAAEKNQPEMINLLINLGISVESTTTQFQQTALHISARHQCLQALMAVLRHTKNINPKNFYGETPLRLAARRGHYEIAKLLLDVEAHYQNEIIHSQLNGEIKLLPSMFLEAVINGHVSMTQLFLERQLVRVSDIPTALHLLNQMLTNTSYHEMLGQKRDLYETMVYTIQQFLHERTAHAAQVRYHIPVAISANETHKRTATSTVPYNPLSLFSMPLKR